MHIYSCWGFFLHTLALRGAWKKEECKQNAFFSWFEGGVYMKHPWSWSIVLAFVANSAAAAIFFLFEFFLEIYVCERNLENSKSMRSKLKFNDKRRSSRRRKRKNCINDQDDENEIISYSFMCMLKLLLLFASRLCDVPFCHTHYAQGKWFFFRLSSNLFHILYCVYRHIYFIFIPVICTFHSLPCIVSSASAAAAVASAVVSIWDGSKSVVKTTALIHRLVQMLLYCFTHTYTHYVVRYSFTAALHSLFVIKIAISFISL